MEDSVTSMFRTAQDTVRRSYKECEGSVREAPGSSLLCAVATGYFLRLLPIGAILSGLVHLVAALLKPAILIFGAAKLYNYVQQQQPEKLTESRSGRATAV